MNKVIIFPTDTVYGIGCKIYDIESINRIYEIKKRPKEKPLACLCASLDQINEIAVVDDVARKLIQKFLPGALTVILEAKEYVFSKIGYKTIGVRIPNSHIALEILKENGPMLTTSVNESGFVPLNEYDDIVKEYGLVVDKIYQTDKESINLASTVVLVKNNEVKILREGPISIDEINKCINESPLVIL